MAANDGDLAEFLSSTELLWTNSTATGGEQEHYDSDRILTTSTLTLLVVAWYWKWNLFLNRKKIFYSGLSICNFPELYLCFYDILIWMFPSPRWYLPFIYHGLNKIIICHKVYLITWSCSTKYSFKIMQLPHEGIIGGK